MHEIRDSDLAATHVTGSAALTAAPGAALGSVRCTQVKSQDTRAGVTSGSSSRSTAALTLQGKRCCGLAAGKEHELQLRKEADAVEPEKLAKRKHQISSLYHAAKLKVTCWSCWNPPCR